MMHVTGWALRGLLISIVAMLVANLAVDAAEPDTPAADRRGQPWRPFQLALAGECTVPAGESAAHLVRRDDIGYGVVVACADRQGLPGVAREKTLAALQQIRR